MASHVGGEMSKVSLMERFIQQGELAYNPELPIRDRTANEESFKHLLNSTKTMALMPVLTSLVQPGHVKPWLRPHILHALAALPLRPQGVRSTIEFVLSVHPSTAQNNGVAPVSVPESRGPSISLEALNSASKLISSPPSNYSADSWFIGISEQLLSLLDGEGGLEMIKAASFIIGYGILGHRQRGAPGTPGWSAFAAPLLYPIDPTLNSNLSHRQYQQPKSADIVLSMTHRDIVVPASELSTALRRLASLLSSHPNPGLSKRLLGRLLLPLWSLSSWPVAKPEDFEEWRAPASYLLQILLQLSTNSSKLLNIADSLLFRGNRGINQLCWTYAVSPEGGIEIERFRGVDDEPSPLDALDGKVEAFIELIKPIKDNDEVPAIFLSLCKRWLSAVDQPKIPQVHYRAIVVDDERKAEQSLIEVKILQAMMDRLPERLVGNTGQVLELAKDVLHKGINNGETSDETFDEDETIAIALSLLNIIFTTTNTKRTSENIETYESVNASLHELAKKAGSQNTATAQNLLFLLENQKVEPHRNVFASITIDKASEDRRTYNLALSYLTSTDSPPPVRAQGIDLITGLISSNSSILDIPATLVLFSSLLQDDEEYIYLRTIKALVLLSAKHPNAVTKDLLDRYIDPNEERQLDARLRLGETLLQVIEKLDSSFSGDLAHHVSGGLLSIAGRRGYRPKTEAQQQKKDANSKRKNQEAVDAWDGEVPQFEDTSLEAELLSHIVEGWESKRGQEDVRIRASALSILGVAIETNIAGMRSSRISEGIDLSINILALEPEHEKAILRRSAILLVMSLVRALDQARDKGTKLGFGFAGKNLEDVLRILKYIEETDNDGLVRQHAKDVIEGLDTWQMKGLLGPRTDVQTQLDELAGLSVNPLRDQDIRTRPRIEEIE